MVNLGSPEIRSSLRDVICWCAIRTAVQDSNSPEETRRRQFYKRLHDLFEQSHREASSVGIKQHSWETKPGKLAQELLSKAWDSEEMFDMRLRSATLRPSCPIADLNSESDWSEAVAEVVSKRRKEINQRSNATDQVDPYVGQILIYEPFENLACGAAQVSSSGFFDVNNVPPWDIWIGFSENAVISWVPPGFTEAAQRGIDANPEQCIQWAR
jgi:hypothetical protein